jgi:CheY-like chemotaxis protein
MNNILQCNEAMYRYGRQESDNMFPRIHESLDQPDWKNKKIVIVEDVLSNFQLLAAYLARTGAQVIHFEKGLPAYEWIKAGNKADVILMDLRLPDLNGIDVTRLIRQINDYVPIIAQTAFAMMGDRDKCLLAGCNDYIAKPIPRKEFLTLLSRHLN